MQERIVVFLDILGFSNLIKSMNADPKLELKILKILNDNYQLENKITWDKVNRLLSKKSDYFSIKYKLTTFSDSLVFSCEKEDFDSMFQEIMKVVRRLFIGGIVCRGGAVIGKLYHDNRIVFGDGLVEAYNTESNLANYPRIVISEELISFVKTYKPKKIKSNYKGILKDYKLPPKLRRTLKSAYLKNNLFKDIDGQWYLNPFPRIYFLENLSNKNLPENDLKLLLKYKKVIEKNIDLNNKNPNIKMKYQWLATKYNEIVVKKWNKENEEKIEKIKI